LGFFTREAELELGLKVPLSVEKVMFFLGKVL
jgi:hypothetical protein